MAHIHDVIDTHPHFTIDPETRVTKKTTPGKAVVMQYDHDSKRITFDMPRYVEGHDMTLCTKVEVHYINIKTDGKKKKEGHFKVKDITISTEDENKITFSWLISQNGTQLEGSLNFLIRFTCTGEAGAIEYAWHTDLCTDIEVRKGMYNTDVVVYQYSDILEQWYEKLFGTPIVRTVNGVAPDESGNVNVESATSWNDLTDKPFGDEGESTEELAPYTEYTFALGGVGGTSTYYPVLENGETYRVTWDNVEYVCVAVPITMDGSSFIAIGDIRTAVDEMGATYDGDASSLPQNGEPFIIVSAIISLDEGSTNFLSLVDVEDMLGEIESSTHGFGLEHVIVGVKTLDEKYLPKDAIIEWIDAYMEEAIGGDY